MKENNTVFPLSPDPNLKEENDRVYFCFLRGALEAERIHNIAITGGFGTGKSSLIRSYEKKKHPIKTALIFLFSIFKRILQIIWSFFFWRNGVSHVDADRKPLNRFLYISVGEYASDARSEGKLTGQQEQPALRSGLTKQEAEQGKVVTSIRSVERRLLLQIFARFRKADLPQSNFRLIPEAWTKRLWLIASLLGCFVFSVLLLIFHKQLGELLVAVNNMEGGPRLGGLIMRFLVKYKTLFRLLLSAYCIGFGALASVFLCVRILPSIRFQTFTVKGANAEFSLEREATESYLDLYSMELVYCLEKLAKKIDYVVVFEDLDRLDPKDCLYIITRLREINNLVNLRLQKKGQHLRFIYAVNDEFLGAVQHEKFFDYILPVVPKMNRRSAAILFAEKIKKIDEKYDVLNGFPQFETVASCLSDFRLQNTILNEYQVLRKLYTTTKRKGFVLDDPQKNELLAFAIYKNCWPGDYHALRENKSQIFTTDGVKCPECLKNAKYGKLLEVLTVPENHLLTIHSLYYANFSEETLSEKYADHWKSAIGDSTKHTGIIAELDTIQKDELKCVSKVREVFNSPSCFCSPLVETNTDKREYYFPLFRAVLNCTVRCGQEDNNWFFVTDQYNICIKLLAGLNEKEDEILKTEFFILSSKTVKDKNNFYGAPVTAISGFNGHGAYSRDELRELCRGVKPIPTGTIIDKVESINPESSGRVTEARKELSTPYFK